MQNDSREGLNTLRTMFPTCDLNTIKTVLASNYGHVERTIEDLLKLTPSKAVNDVSVNQDESKDNVFEEPRRVSPPKDWSQSINEEHLEGVKIYYDTDFARTNDIKAVVSQMDADTGLAAKLYSAEVKKDREMQRRANSWFGFIGPSLDEDGNKKPGFMSKMSNMLKKKKPGTEPPASAILPVAEKPVAPKEVVSADPRLEIDRSRNERSFEVFIVSTPKTNIKGPIVPIDISERPEKSFEMFHNSILPQRDQPQSVSNVHDKNEKSIDFLPKQRNDTQIEKSVDFFPKQRNDSQLQSVNNVPDKTEKSIDFLPKQRNDTQIEKSVDFFPKQRNDSQLQSVNTDKNEKSIDFLPKQRNDTQSVLNLFEKSERTVDLFPRQEDEPEESIILQLDNIQELYGVFEVEPSQQPISPKRVVQTEADQPLLRKSETEFKENSYRAGTYNRLYEKQDYREPSSQSSLMKLEDIRWGSIQVENSGFVGEKAQLGGISQQPSEEVLKLEDLVWAS